MIGEHYKLFKEMDDRYKVILKYEKYYLDEKLLYSFMNDFKILLYENIYKVLEPNKENPECEKAIRFYCNYIEENIEVQTLVNLQEFVKNNME